MLSWDNTARKQKYSHIFHNFSIGRYKQWLSSAINKTYNNDKYVNDKFVFINAWNEWAEGTHLEPDQKYGFSYLQATYDSIKNYDSKILIPIKNKLPNKKKNPIAIVLHLFYLEVWDDFKVKLKKSFKNKKFDLYITICDSSIASKIKKDFPGAYIMLVENRGRDILPFIKVMKLINTLDYEIVCKLHSKRSLYRDDGDSIRQDILESLIGSEKKILGILELFNKDSKLGIVAPLNFILSHSEKNMTYDKEIVDYICNKVNLDFTYDSFVAGSMFWFKPQALLGLINSLDESFFGLESGLADGTFSHGVERLFTFFAKKTGFSTIGVN
jgi:lipopolysaccharide biosynthesis protein